jgi:hypothetical protein
MPTDPDHRLPVAQAARLFALLGDETRLRVLLAVADADGDVPVGGLAKALGLSRIALNHRLRVLRMAGRRRHLPPRGQECLLRPRPRARPRPPLPARPAGR